MEIIKSVKETDKDILDMYYGTESGKFFMYPEAEMPEGYDARQRPWYKQALEHKGQVVITPPYEDVATGSTAVGIVQTVEINGEVVGVIGIDLTLDTLAERISTKTVGSTGYVYLSNVDGIVLAHPQKEIVNTDAAAKLSIWDTVKSDDSGFINYDFNGVKKFGVYEFKDLSDSFNSMIKNISELMNNVTTSSKTVLETSTSLAAMSEEVTASINEVARAIEDGSTGATEQVHNAQKGASEMNESTKQINAISETIAAITEQTNLLSLNASIESARAGEAGKGFAVVAEEIRKLAEQSKVLTEEIKAIIGSIQRKSDTAVKAIKSTEIVVNEQELAVGETKQIFSEILKSIEILISKVDEVKISIVDINEKKQSTVSQIENISYISEQTASASEEVTASTQEITATMEELTRHSSELQVLAEKLGSEISRFKTN